MDRPTPPRSTPADDPALVIFDCDGVLVDSERLAVRIEAQLIGDLGWPITEEEILDRFVGRSDRYVLGEIERTVGRPVPDWTERYEAALHAAFRAELGPVPGIGDALDRLERATCVASSGSHEKMQLTLGLTGLHDRFDGRIFSGTQVANGKPAPDLFLFAASEMGVEPHRCIVVEDSRSGIAAARAAGMRSLGFAGGLTPASWLEGPGTVVFDDMADLVRLIEARPSAWPT
jgi:HAD superfamily hydrolase (TIGR01509 family)